MGLWTVEPNLAHWVIEASLRKKVLRLRPEGCVDTHQVGSEGPMSVPGRRNGICKGPGVRKGMVCLTNGGKSCETRPEKETGGGWGEAGELEPAWSLKLR